MKPRGIFAMFAVMAMAMFLAAPVKAQSQTAQSVMVDIQGATDFVVVGEQTWAYNTTTARTYFTNTLASGPEITCTGGGTGGINCAAGNQPATPSAPAPDASKLTSVVAQNKCTFWDGGTLDVQAGQGSYTQSVTINGSNGRGNWKYVWTYNVAVGATNPVSAQTAWELVSETGGLVDVCVNITIAGESVNVKKWDLCNGPKYSFTLRNTGDTTVSTRIVGLTVTLSDTDPDTADIVNNPSHTLVDGDLTNNCLSDFNYYGNAGQNGKPGALGYLHAPGRLAAATMGNILDNDCFSKNGPAPFSNCASTTKADVDPICYQLGDGSYTVTVSGTVKGVEGAASTNFAGTGSFCINAGTCQTCP